MKTQIGKPLNDTVSKAPLAVAPFSQPGRIHRAVSWAGTCTSALCAVHCFGTAILAVLSPGLLKLLPHSEFAEMIVLGISVVTAFLSLSRVRTRPYQWMLFALFAGIGIAGLALHIHILLAVSLATLAALQLWVLWNRHHPTRKNDVPACCQHENSHGH